ncbi:hypothetical protein CBL_10427 [Carabus blaptoides fortunei]
MCFHSSGLRATTSHMFYMWQHLKICADCDLWEFMNDNEAVEADQTICPSYLVRVNTPVGLGGVIVPENGELDRDSTTVVTWRAGAELSLQADDLTMPLVKWTVSRTGSCHTFPKSDADCERVRTSRWDGK